MGLLSNRIVQASHGSPRRVIQLLNELVNVHSQRVAKEPGLTEEDWKAISDIWSYNGKVLIP